MAEEAYQAVTLLGLFSPIDATARVVRANVFSFPGWTLEERRITSVIQDEVSIMSVVAGDVSLCELRSVHGDARIVYQIVREFFSRVKKLELESLADLREALIEMRGELEDSRRKKPDDPAFNEALTFIKKVLE